MENTEPIENREIRGVSVKNIITMIMCTGSLMLTTLTTYFNLKADISDVRNSKDSDAKLNDLKMRVMDQKIDFNTIQIKELSKRFEDNPKK